MDNRERVREEAAPRFLRNQLSWWWWGVHVNTCKTEIASNAWTKRALLFDRHRLLVVRVSEVLTEAFEKHSQVVALPWSVGS